MALNHIAIMGRLTRDPELRYTQSGKPVVSFTLAVDRDFDKGVDFIDCVAWNQTAQFVNKYFSKGKQAIVAGRLQMRDWHDRDGNKRISAEIVAANVYFGDSKKSEQGYGDAPKYDTNEPNGYSGSRFAELDEDDGDLPF